MLHCTGKNRLLLAGIILSTLHPAWAESLDLVVTASAEVPSYIREIRAPAGLTPPETASPVVIAIVDDAVARAYGPDTPEHHIDVEPVTVLQDQAGAGNIILAINLQ